MCIVFLGYPYLSISMELGLSRHFDLALRNGPLAFLSCNPILPLSFPPLLHHYPLLHCFIHMPLQKTQKTGNLHDIPACSLF